MTVAYMLIFVLQFRRQESWHVWAWVTAHWVLCQTPSCQKSLVAGSGHLKGDFIKHEHQMREGGTALLFCLAQACYFVWIKSIHEIDIFGSMPLEVF